MNGIIDNHGWMEKLDFMSLTKSQKAVHIMILCALGHISAKYLLIPQNKPLI